MWSELRRDQDFPGRALTGPRNMESVDPTESEGGTREPAPWRSLSAPEDQLQCDRSVRGTVGKEGYNLLILHVNQVPEVAVAFVACCLGDLVFKKEKMKIQAHGVQLKTHSCLSPRPLQGVWTQQTQEK